MHVQSANAQSAPTTLELHACRQPRCMTAMCHLEGNMPMRKDQAAGSAGAQLPAPAASPDQALQYSLARRSTARPAACFGAAMSPCASREDLLKLHALARRVVGLLKLLHRS